VADDLQLWQRINHCAPDPTTEKLPDHGDDGTHVERIRFHGCAAGGEVTHYRILEAGHVCSPDISTRPRDSDRRRSRSMRADISPGSSLARLNPRRVNLESTATAKCSSCQFAPYCLRSLAYGLHVV